MMFSLGLCICKQFPRQANVYPNGRELLAECIRYLDFADQIIRKALFSFVSLRFFSLFFFLFIFLMANQASQPHKYSKRTGSPQVAKLPLSSFSTDLLSLSQQIAFVLWCTPHSLSCFSQYIRYRSTSIRFDIRFLTFQPDSR